jgi:hypothetical protein
MNLLVVQLGDEAGKLLRDFQLFANESLAARKTFCLFLRKAVILILCLFFLFMRTLII